MCCFIFVRAQFATLCQIVEPILRNKIFLGSKISNSKKNIILLLFPNYKGYKPGIGSLQSKIRLIQQQRYESV